MNKKNLIKSSFIVLGIVIISFFLIFHFYKNKEKYDGKILWGGSQWSINILKTTEQQRHTLENKKILPKNTGYFLIFQKYAYASFWGKNLNFSIMVIFFNKKGNFLESMILQKGNPTIKTTKEKVFFALEVNLQEGEQALSNYKKKKTALVFLKD